MNWKKTTTCMLALSLASASAAFAVSNVMAKPSTMQVTLNGAPVGLAGYEIQGNNYFKLRDLAYALRETESRFSVDFDGKTISLAGGKDYVPVGGEMAASGAGAVSAKYKDDALSINQKMVTLTAYEIDGYNYFKLRDLGDALDFGVDYEEASRTVILKTKERENIPSDTASTNPGDKADKECCDMITIHPSVEVEIKLEEDASDKQEDNPFEDWLNSNQKPAEQPEEEQKPEQPEEEQEEAPSVPDAEAVLALMNEARAEEGTSALVLDDKLCEAAEIRAKELEELFSHDRPDGSKCFSVLEDIGWSGGYGALGENIAMGQTTPEIVMNSWMNSPGHRANILNGQFSKVGIARYQNGWVQFFLG